MAMDILQGWGEAIARGAAVTVAVALMALALGLVWGVLGALARLSSSRILRRLGAIYTTVIRGTPELLIILIVYFGGTVALTAFARKIVPDAGYVEVPSIAAGVFALSLIFGGYAAETIRGAFQAIPRGQIEAAEAFGLTGWVGFVHIRFPLMWRYALPALGNNWISLVKDTSLISVVGLEELMRVSAMATSVTREPFIFYLVAALVYLALTFVNTTLLGWMEARSQRGERRV
jgi:His/Glu/Gln/Arg/opine family amino acid ABC transporter permease subunit